MLTHCGKKEEKIGEASDSQKKNTQITIASMNWRIMVSEESIVVD